MERTRHGWLAAVVAVFALGAFAPVASAATVQVTDDGTEQVLTYTAAPGEVNNLLIEGGPDYQVAELTPVLTTTVQPTITPGANCNAYPPPGDPVGSNGVSCHIPGQEVDRVVIDLGDQDDQIEIMSADAPVTINGGEGNDLLDDTEQTNGAVLWARTFDGGPGDDYFRAAVLARLPDEFIGGAGTDTADFNYRTAAQTISLDDVANDGSTGEGDNIHADVEYAFGGSGADTITGTENVDYLMGFGGADNIKGLGGDDTLIADHGSVSSCSADVLDAGAGVDELVLEGNTTADGGVGDDTFFAAAADCPGGADVAEGGDGSDTADFWAVKVDGLTVSLDEVANDGFGGADNFKNIEAGFGPETHGITMIGDDGPNRLVGRGGNDVIDGGLGADSIEGGGGLLDTADYSKRTTPVTLTLNGAADDGAAGEGDTIGAGIENLRGGSAADTLTGDANANVLDGGLGADMITGGDGVDTVDYSHRTAAVTVTLAAGSGNGETGENDSFSGDIEGAFGGAGNDKLTGNLGDGLLKGFAGNDELIDRGGKDALDAGIGNDVVDSVDGAVDTVVCGAGTDTVTADAIDTRNADCTDTAPPVDPPDDTTPPTKPGNPTKPGDPTKPGNPTDPTTPDLTVPKASLAAAGKLKLGKLRSSGLKFGVKSNEAATLSANLMAEKKTLKALKKRGITAKTVLAKSSRVTATGGVRKTLTVKLNKRGRKALRGMASGRFKLVVVVTDRAGNKLTIVQHLRLG